jgi:uncharacterized protein YjbI with pentapeptide repeats
MKRDRLQLLFATAWLFASSATCAAGATDAPLDLACPQQPAGPAQPANHAGQTLVNVNFAWRDLRNADFSGATLDGVIFVGADLRGANFRNARFTNSLNGSKAANLPTDFSEAKLGSACFIKAAFQATAAPVYLTNADLTCTDFSGTDISKLNAIFGDAPLVTPGSSCRTRFTWATMNCEFIDLWPQVDLSNSALGACAAGPTPTVLVGRDFTGAMMDGFDFYQANLAGVTFSNAQLHGANLAFTNLKGAKFIGAQGGVQPGTGSSVSAINLTAAYMVGVDLTDADLRSATLTGAHIYAGTATNGGVSFVRTRLDSADLSGALLPAAVFSGSLTNAVFDSAIMPNASFNNADLSFAKFVSTYLHGVDFSKASSVHGTSLNNAAVSLAAGNWNFTEQDGSITTYAYAATLLGAIGTGSGAFCPSNEVSPCTGTKLNPVANGPFPPVPKCVPKGPKYDNCLPPKP